MSKLAENKATERETVSFKDLPLISVLGPKTMKSAQALLEELDGHEYYRDPKSRELVKRSDRVDQIKRELEEIQTNFDKPGLRFGGLCYSARESEGRETIDRGLLLEVGGLTPAEIQQCTKKGKPFVTRTFKRIVI